MPRVGNESLGPDSSVYLELNFRIVFARARELPDTKVPKTRPKRRITRWEAYPLPP